MNASTATNSFAEQQLAKYGWKKGQGLGKNSEGVKRAITVSRRTDSRGIGSDSNQWNSNWWDHLYNKASGNSSTADTPQTTLSEDDKEEEREFQSKMSLAANERDTIGDYQGLFVRAVSTSVSTIKVSESLQSSGAGNRVDRTQFTRDGSIHLGSTGISDAELFAACEGRMARKGARAEQNGKLARVHGDGMPRPEVAARIEAALSGRLRELDEEEKANDKKKRKREDNDTRDRKEKKKKSKSKSISKSKDKEKSKRKDRNKSRDKQKDTDKRSKS